MDFKKGQIVKHKISTRRMVVIGTRNQRTEGGWFNAPEKITIKENQVEYRYENESRDAGRYFTSKWFSPEELILTK